MFNENELKLIELGLYTCISKLQENLDEYKEDLEYWQKEQNTETFAEEYIKEDLECIKQREEKIKEVNDLLLKLKEN